MKKRTLFALLVCCSSAVWGQKSYNSPGAGNPIIPGYFADPTVQKFGDTYYMYATTDGNGGGLGPSQVWTSKDFVNWFIEPMNWPTTHHIWAPDVMKHSDGKYYMFYCIPCEIYGGVSDTPVGPWKNYLGKENEVLVPNYYVDGAITLDGQTFVDDDGSVYLYWGTWGIYANHGCGVGKFNPDLKSFSETKLIPNTDAIDFFEAPYVFKRNGIYYFTYSSGSCHDHTYRVQYATSKEGPMGPFKYADNNPILETNADGSVHGPGHHGMVIDGDDHYMIYHQHDAPKSTRGMHRQIAAAKLSFDEEGRINKIVPGHDGIGFLGKNTNPYPNLAFGKKVKASSYYDELFKPVYAVDDNNGTLWRPKSCGKEWIEIDLGKVMPVTRIWTQFEYATSFYQYIIETSKDGQTWETFADRTANTQAGSPMMDNGKAKARYVRLTTTGSERNGMMGAIWNIKIFNKGKDPVVRGGSFNGQSTAAAPARKGLIFDINADDYEMKEPLSRIENRANKSESFNATRTPVPVRLKEGKAAFIFNGKQEFRSSFALPNTFLDNAPFSVMSWIYMEKLSPQEYILDLTHARGELQKVSVGYGTNPANGLVAHSGSYEDMGVRNLGGEKQWQHLAVTFDGYREKIYVNDKLIKEKDVVLRLPASDYITIGRSAGSDADAFQNSLHSLALYDTPLEAEEISAHYAKGIPNSRFANKAGMSDLEGINTAPQVRALTPQSVKVSVAGNADNYALQYHFENETTGVSSGWSSEPQFMEFGLTPNSSYTYKVKLKDTFGNTKELEAVTVKMTTDNFTLLKDDFGKATNYQSFEGTIWSGLAMGKPETTTAENKEGALVLTSSHTQFQGSGRDNGPLLYVTIAKNFVAETKVSDLTGRADRKSVSFLEGGLMVKLSDSPHVLHLGLFPHYNVGNILTELNRGYRVQYKNDKSWAMDYHLQVEREGNQFFFRTSADGKSWTEMLGSPITARIAEGAEVQVGLYQTTYSDNEGSVMFDDFTLWVEK